jgi:hypothetical protein
MKPFHLTVSATASGDYKWTLYHGPDGVFTDCGTCTQLEAVFEAIKEAELDLAQSLTP